MKKQRTFSSRINDLVFWGIHVLPIAAIWTGISWRAAVLAIILYVTRMFVITAGYHRYFSHRSYKTSRLVQFLIGLFGTTCVQKGPIWWAARHRHHHKFSDQPEDVHSPVQHGLYEAHLGWVGSGRYNDTDLGRVRDLVKFPELRWLDTYHWIPPLALTVLCYCLAGWSGVVVGMGWSTLIFWHATFTINSLAHVWGSRRYATNDTSRNNLVLAIITMGEGWHNNHHHYMASARQGFFWWEIDVSYYVLWVFARLGLIWDVKKPPTKSIHGSSFTNNNQQLPATESTDYARP